MPNFTPISVANKQQVLAKLCEQLDAAVFILDANLRYLSVNDSYETMIGYREASILGRPLVYMPQRFYQQKKEPF